MRIPSVRELPIRLRLTFWFAVFLLVSVVGIGAFLIASLESDLHDEIDEALWLRASRVEREVTTGADARLDPGDVRADLLALSPLEEFALPGIYVQVLDVQGSVLATSPNLSGGNLPVTADLTAEALAGRTTYVTLPAESEHVRVLLRPLTGNGQIIGASWWGNRSVCSRWPSAQPASSFSWQQRWRRSAAFSGCGGSPDALSASSASTSRAR